ncbi:MAG: trigger factor [Firmicutes bacterium]|nr:trigger factor [Bacillota bacterium]
MKTTVERLEGNQVALEVEVGQERVEQALDQAFRKVAQQVRVPGFRPGKAPRRVIEMRVGKELLYQEALDDLIPRVYTEAISESGIKPIDMPELDILEMEDGKPLRFKAVVEVEPEVTLGEYKGIAATKQIERITNADVDRVLEEMRERSAQLVTTDRQEIQTGDFAIIDFTGYIDEQPFPGGAAQGYTLEIGAGQFIPGFEEQLVGSEPGETKQVTVTFPTDYHATELAGKEARFDVKIHEIKEKSYPALNDDFAKDLGDFETLLELRADIRQRLEDAAAKDAQNTLEVDLTQKAVDLAQVDIPDKMVELQIDHKIQHLERDLQYSGLDKERYLEILGTTEEELRSRMWEEAENEVKTTLVLEAIVAKEGITVTDEEIDERIDSTVQDSPHADTLRSYWESQKRSLRNNMLLEKAVALLVDNGEITEVVVDRPEEDPNEDLETAEEATESEDTR